jgi:glycosyltransferase involved in cell wall biosynthesis
VITSFNQKEYLQEAIDSVLAQTVPAHQIIVSDDCSTDGSQDMIRHYELRHPGLITAIYQPENLGIPRNRTAALRLATADFVAILDGDDRYLPGNLEAQLGALIHSPGTECVFSNIYFIDERGHRTGVRDTLRPADENLSYSIALGRMGIERSMVMRTELVRQAGYLDPRFPYHDGFILTLALATKSDFAYVLEPQAEYRVHAHSDSKGIALAQRLAALEAVAVEVAEITSGVLGPEESRQVEAAWRQRRNRLKLDLVEQSGNPVLRLWHMARAFLQSTNRRRALGRWIGGADARTERTKGTES